MVDVLRVFIDVVGNTHPLFQVGRFEVNLISPDSKTVVLEKNFKDISSCCQVGLFLLQTPRSYLLSSHLSSVQSEHEKKKWKWAAGLFCTDVKASKHNTVNIYSSADF